jgi:hypothetical protein
MLRELIFFALKLLIVAVVGVLLAWEIAIIIGPPPGDLITPVSMSDTPLPLCLIGVIGAVLACWLPDMIFDLLGL